ncbi:MAG: TauD/TfdA family dioxygenase [Alphaproteobacteria bacterium]
MQCQPISGALGAEVTGVDVTALDDDGIAAVRAALAAHGVLAIREQDLTPDQHKAFCRRLGDLLPVPFVQTLADHPEIIPVVKEAGERTGEVFGGTWHSDFSFLPVPPLASCLYAREVPPYGGDTAFASMTRAFEGLSDGMKRFLRATAVVHSGKRSYGTQGRFASDQLNSIGVAVSEDGDAEVAHPAVVAIAGSNRPALFVNGVYAIRFQDMTEAESQPLLDYLCAQARRLENTCRLQWAKGTLALWDNRAVLHYAINDYDGQRREMHRVTIAGAPLSPA